MDDGVTEIRELVFSDNNMSPAGKKQRVEEEKEEPHSNVGAINNFISSFMSNDKEAENGNGMKDETREGKEEGGILNNLISSLVSPRSKANDIFTSVNDEKMAGEEKGGGGGGGFIDSIVSHLPSPLSDDAAPATDEASILIHSIVHD